MNLILGIGSDAAKSSLDPPLEARASAPATHQHKVHRQESNDARTQYRLANGVVASAIPSFVHPAQRSSRIQHKSNNDRVKTEVTPVLSTDSVTKSSTPGGAVGSPHSTNSATSNTNNTTTNGNNIRWNSWSHEEEVFLVVSVLDRFFRRGSLASATKSNNSNMDCWGDIKCMYDRICEAWHKLPENRVKPAMITRSTSALCRHFKIMKVRAAEGDANGTHEGNFRKYLREWDTTFNVNGKLIPEEY